MARDLEANVPLLPDMGATTAVLQEEFYSPTASSPEEKKMRWKPPVVEVLRRQPPTLRWSILWRAYVSYTILAVVSVFFVLRTHGCTPKYYSPFDDTTNRFIAVAQGKSSKLNLINLIFPCGAVYHSGFPHIFWNHFLGFIIGVYNERWFGAWRYTLWYLGTSALVNTFETGMHVTYSCGTSTVIYGIIFYDTIRAFFLWKSATRFERMRLGLTLTIFCGRMIMMGTLYKELAANSSTVLNHIGHVTSCVLGTLLAVVLDPRINYSRLARSIAAFLLSIAYIWGILRLFVWNGWAPTSGVDDFVQSNPQ